jgi:hypothetical protein
MEAYSWGGLTSGDNTRALWLLLLPFMLLNVAFFMTPYRRSPDVRLDADGLRAQRLDRFSASVQRLLALSFTATFALTTITVAMDLVGWQCVAAVTGGDVCGTSWLSWLAWSGFDPPGRPTAVTALGPLAVIGLLWRLAGATWQHLEISYVPAPREAAAVTPLEDRSMWNGRAAVRRLRALHVATGLALPGVFALAPLRPGPAVVLSLSVRDVVLALLIAVLVTSVVLVGLPVTGRRERPAALGPVSTEEARRSDEQARAEQAASERRGFYRFWPWVALAVTVVALVVAWSATAAVPTGGALPWLDGTVQGLALGQAALLLTLLGVCVALKGRADTTAAVPPAWKGLALPGIALLAWVLAAGFSAGVILRAARFLGTPVADPGDGVAHPLVVPVAFTWAAAAAVVLLALAVVAAGTVWWRLRAPTDEEKEQVAAAYGPVAGENPHRRDNIALAWHRATRLTAYVQTAFGVLLLTTAVVVVAGAVDFVWDGPGLIRNVPALVTAGDLVITGFVLVLVYLGRQAYRSPATRRSVGIAWDLGTFWPRSVHPLAPPCYAERAVPDLLLRLEHDVCTDRGRVLLSCHSQGSVLGAAVLLQADTRVVAGTSLLTYGSPLARLYGRFFPAYVNPATLDRLGSLLSAGPAEGRASWRWRNLYRPSDPIGGPVFRARPLHEDDPPDRDPGDVDRPLHDPAFDKPPGDPCYPPVLGHSNYFADPAFAWTTQALLAGTLPRTDLGEVAASGRSGRLEG